MSNLSENINKYLINKGTDLGTIVIFIGLLVFFMSSVKNTILLAVYSIATLVLFLFAGSQIEKKYLSKIIVPAMDLEDTKKYYYVDAIYTFVVGVIIVWVASIFINSSGTLFLAIAAAVLFLVKEIRVYINYKKMKYNKPVSESINGGNNNGVQ